MLVLPTISLASDLTRISSGQVDKLALGPHLELFEDRHGEFGIGQVSSPDFPGPFHPVSAEQLNLGYSQSVLWLRFRLHWTNADALLLQLAFPLMDYVDFFIPGKAGEYQQFSAGDRQPVSNRQFHAAEFLFALPSMANTEQTYYLRIQSDGTLQLPLYLWSPTTFAEASGKEQFRLGAYYGIMLAMILYNLFLLLFVQDRNYLHYVLYIASYLLFQMSLNGYAQLYFWPEQTEWANRSVPFFIGLVILLATNFSRQFLTTRDYLPKTDITLRVLMALGLSVMLGSLFLDYNVITPFANLVGILLPLILLPAGFLSLHSGYRPARFYVIAWSTFLVGIFITGIMFLGVLPRNAFTIYAIQIGSAMEVILLSIALADRISLLRREKEAAQRESTQHLRRLNEELETLVEQRTAELADYATKLEHRVSARTAGGVPSRSKQVRGLSSVGCW